MSMFGFVKCRLRFGCTIRECAAVGIPNASLARSANLDIDKPHLT